MPEFPSVKKLRIVRHSIKKEGTEIIGEDGLLYAQNNAPAGDYTDFFYGPLFRTIQTLLAVVASHGFKGKVHPPIEEVGNDELFDKIYTKEMEELAEKEELSDIEAFYQAVSHERIKEIEEYIAGGVRKMFEMMDKNFGLCYGHEPIISIVAKVFGYKTSEDLKELAYIDFELSGNKTIRVVGIHLE